MSVLFDAVNVLTGETRTVLVPDRIADALDASPTLFGNLRLTRAPLAPVSGPMTGPTPTHIVLDEIRALPPAPARLALTTGRPRPATTQEQYAALRDALTALGRELMTALQPTLDAVAALADTLNRIPGTARPTRQRAARISLPPRASIPADPRLQGGAFRKRGR